jgi:hypothetical protein
MLEKTVQDGLTARDGPQRIVFIGVLECPHGDPNTTTSSSVDRSTLGSISTV